VSGKRKKLPFLGKGSHFRTRKKKDVSPGEKKRSPISGGVTRPNANPVLGKKKNNRGKRDPKKRVTKPAS